MTNSIRVKNDNMKIEVNDQGEYIVLPFSDQGFPKRVYELLKRFNDKKDELTALGDSINDITGEAAVDKNLEIHQFFKEETDRVFGEDTCRKVFGEGVPSMEQFTDFYEQVTPFFNEFSKKRKAMADKYNAGRGGNR